MSAKRFAVYARVSSPGQAEDGHSLDDQRALAQGVIDREGGVLAKMYAGDESAMGAKLRPKFEQMLRDAAAGKFDALLISSDTRESRNPIDVERLRAVFLKHRVALYMGGRQEDLRSSAARIGRLIKATVSQEETNARLDASARSRIQQACLGFATSGGFPFGRSIKPLLVGTRRMWATDAKGEAVWHADADAERYVQQAAAMYLAGQSWQEVAEAVPWPGEEGATIGNRANALRRRVLAGGDTWDQRFILRGNQQEDFSAIRNRDRVRFEGDEAIVSTPIPPLLDAATLKRIAAKSVNRYLDRKQAKPHALNGLLRCGMCGSALTIRNHQEPTGLAVRVSHHALTRHADCPGSFLRYEPIELSVLGWLSSMLRDEQQVEAAVRQALAAAVPDADELRQELSAVQRTMKADADSLTAARHNLLAVKLDPEEADAMGKRLAMLKASMASKQERISALQQRLEEAQVQPEHEAAIKATLKKFRKGHALIQATVAQQREALKAMFGYGSLRNRPANAKEGSPEMGIFLRWVQDPQTKEHFVQWRALGRFFLLDGAVSWDEQVQFGWAAQRAWSPDAAQLAGVAGALGANALGRGARRWSASTCPGTFPPASATCAGCRGRARQRLPAHGRRAAGS